jgi:arylsulfatase A-like enzyme
MHVPLLAIGPGFTAGTTTVPVTGQDITATVCAILGVTPPITQDGVDLRDVQDNPGSYSSRKLLHQGRNDTSPDDIPDWDGITTETRKLIRYVDDDFMEIYDLENDPNELVNLALDSGYDAERAALEADLDTLLAA